MSGEIAQILENENNSEAAQRCCDGISHLVDFFNHLSTEEFDFIKAKFRRDAKKV
jgi:hypothetical protein